MIAEFSFLAWYLGLSVPLYWALPATWPGLRRAFLVVVSILLLWMLSPFILAVVAFYALIVLGFGAAISAGVARKRLKSVSWGVFIPLILVEFVPVDLLTSGLLGPRAIEIAGIRGFALLGLSYTAIRCFVMCRETIDGPRPTPFEAVSAFVFFGSFVAGPIAGAAPFRKPASQLSLDDALTGFARIGWGAAVFLVFRAAVAQADVTGWMGIDPQGTAAAWVETYRAFLVLYLDFAGYSEIAIGTALLFGVRMPENFRYPFLARSMQEFWQRWHLSLGAFIGTYLFKPLVRSYGKPPTAIFLAFVIVGLWHRFALPYFLWGIGHGAGLALGMYLRKRAALKTPAATPRSPVMTVIENGAGWLFTMSYVAILSRFATSPDIGTAGRYILSLVGGGS